MGNTYERSAILKWLSSHGTCPMTRRPMKPSNLIPNALMKAKVTVWKGRQRDGSSGGTPTKYNEDELLEQGEGIGFVFFEPSTGEVNDRLSSESHSSPERHPMEDLLADYLRMERDFEEQDEILARDRQSGSISRKGHQSIRPRSTTSGTFSRRDQRISNLRMTNLRA
eukprot:Nitzschia sp. Nitz4//scaffold113_size70149//69474//69977//NITZ4_005965-RA/size70149-exonerate_protein2genome-gene-0.23-mRNA-1//1//CDS//3329533386//840//frame0